MRDMHVVARSILADLDGADPSDVREMEFHPPTPGEIEHFANMLFGMYPRLTPGLRSVGRGVLRIAISMSDKALSEEMARPPTIALTAAQMGGAKVCPHGTGQVDAETQRLVAGTE